MFITKKFTCNPSNCSVQATSEVPLQIDVMNITDVDMKLSFKADAVSRPRITNQVGAVTLSLLQID